MLFGKKKKIEQVTPPKAKECDHKYRDFPWYIESKFTRSTTYYGARFDYNIKIMEPYVCIHCKKRKDVLLQEFSASGVSYETYENTFNQICNRYKDHLKDKAVIEDMINDMQLVDQEYLKWYRIVKGQEEMPKPKLSESESIF